MNFLNVIKQNAKKKSALRVAASVQLKKANVKAIF